MPEFKKYHRPRPSICQNCSQPFSFHLCTQRTQKFCSRNCYAEWRAAHAFTPCKRCAKPVPKVTRRVYCSAECHGKPDPTSAVDTTCSQCCKPIKKHRGQLKVSKKSFCSYKCKYKADEIRVTMICEHCKATRTGYPSEINNLRFCSPECVRKSRHETGPEKRVRLALEKLSIVFIAQHSIEPYSIDFFLPLLNIALEVDGNYWHQTEAIKQKDALRDEQLKAVGITTVRLPFEDTKKFIRSDVESLLRSRLRGS